MVETVDCGHIVQVSGQRYATINYTDVVAACRPSPSRCRRLSTDAQSRSHTLSDRPENSQIGARSDPVISSFVCPHRRARAVLQRGAPDAKYNGCRYTGYNIQDIY